MRGAPEHFSRAVRDVLNNTYHDRWMGREGPNAWRPRSPDLNPLHFYLWGHLRPRVYASPVDNEGTRPHRIVDACQTIRNYPGTLNGCGGPWWDVSRRALNLMENTLSTYYKCTLSDITHKLNVCGHMLIWTFFLVLACGTRAQSLSAPFSYTLHINIKVCIYIIKFTRVNRNDVIVTSCSLISIDCVI
jgi:hypothetical protein